MKTVITYRIPGGWYGNEPGFLPAYPAVGNVTVDAKRIAAALAWLSRRAKVIATKGVAEYPNREAVGILIDYRLKQRGA